MKKPKAELLSPAGSLAALKAVANAGADAVYGAGARFGARAYAENFTREELLEALDYLHIHGKRFYLTVNTLLKEQELSGQLYEEILPLYRQGLDGVIVQDLGVLIFLREQFPDLELHASTQMSITGAGGARLMKDMGCSRIVPARELSLEELSEIHREVDIEIESFVHGALCYCYSGQCLLSSMLGGRSGNRGRCAQPCRLPYRTEGGREGYLLSPKDLCTIELLPQILESGVYSLKIEGRMKQLEYAAGVTGIYREYLDRCLEHPTERYQVEPEDLKRLQELGSRSGYTRGYYEQRNGPGMMAMEKSSHTSGDEELRQEVHRQYAGVGLQEKIKGILRLSKGLPALFLVEWNGVQASAEAAAPLEAQKQPLTREGVAEKLCKTGNSDFTFEELEIQLEDGLFLAVSQLNRLRREALDRLREGVLMKFRRETPLPEPARPYPERAVKLSYLAVEVRTVKQLKAVLEFGFVDRVYLEADALPRTEALEEWTEAAELVHSRGKKLYYVLPAVLRAGSAAWHREHLPKLAEIGADGFVTGSYEGLGLLEEAFPKNGTHPVADVPIVADSSLYVWNSQSRRAMAQAGADEITLSAEANRQELLHRGFLGGELLLYGYLPLMVSAQCLRKNTDKCTGQSGLLPLKDRYGKEFPVQSQCMDCYNIIYNSSPLWLFHQKKHLEQLQASGYRISFTLESEAEIRKIMSVYEQAFVRGAAIEPDSYPRDYTNGHFKRGVE